MSDEGQIKWVTVTLDFPPEAEATLEANAHAAGLSLKCYCIHVLYNHLLKDASDVQKEKWQRQFPDTLCRNGCIPAERLVNNR